MLLGAGELRRRVGCFSFSRVCEAPSVAMHAALHDAWATSLRLPQPTQEITDFQRLTHEPRGSAQDKAAFTDTHTHTHSSFTGNDSDGGSIGWR